MASGGNDLVQPGFAERLSQAIAHRGLSLNRIRARLAARDLDVSIATLSYWATGRSRPARSKSLDAVRELEDILQVEPGWLVDAMGRAPRSHHLSEVMGREELSPREIRERELPSPAQWQPVVSHRRILVDERGVEWRFETEALLRAQQADARQWCVVVQQRGEGWAVAEPMGIARLEQVVPLDDDLTAFVFGLERAVPRGEVVLTGHAVEIRDVTRRFSETIFAVDSLTPYLVLEVIFDGPLPRRIGHWHRAPGGEAVHQQDLTLPLEGGRVQCVVTDAAPGQHVVRVSW